MSVKKRILSGVFSGGFGLIVTLITQVALVPIFLQYWGVERYAIWLVLFAVPTFLSLTDLGLINVLTNKALKYYSLERKKIASIYLYSAFIFIFPVSLILSFFIYYIFYIFSSQAYSSLGMPVFIYLSIYSALLLISNLIVASFRALRLFHIGSFGVNILRLIDFFVILTILILSSNEVNMSFYLLLFRTIGCVFLVYILYTKVPVKNLNVKWELLYLNARSSLNYFIIPLCNIAINQGVLILIGMKFPPHFIVVFNTLRVMFRFLNLTTGIFVNAFRQEITFSFFNEVKEYRMLQKKLLNITFLISIFSIFLFYFFGDEVLKLWVGADFKYSNFTFFSILYSVVLNNFTLKDILVVNSTNHHELYTKKLLIMTSIFLSTIIFSTDFKAFLIIMCFFDTLIFMYTFYIRKCIEKLYII